MLALKLRLGSLEPFAGDAERDVPVYERFFSGGSTTVRGFDYQELGPQDEDGDPAGGFSLLEASAELRFPIWRALGGVAFVDAGQVGAEPWRFRGSDLFFSVGAGLRYSTPVGPLRVDLAQVIDPPDGQDGLRIHFSIGHAF